ncbi:MAG TPA: SRPBCC family protein, partial [Actinomycetota bacterium]|nr:SRPBCC family protein [Actinomycetota bacterium]
MQKVDRSIEVDAPISTVYNQWTKFETFPAFMEGVEAVAQLDDATVHWVAEVGGTRKEWDARITEQIPDEVIAWE